MPQQRLVRRLDRDLACILGHISGKQMLHDEVIDKGPGFGGNFRHPRDAATRAAGFRIDSGKPGNEATAKEYKSRITVARNRRVRIGRFQRALDCGLDRALDAAECLIVGEP